MKENKWIRLLAYVTGLVNQELLSGAAPHRRCHAALLHKDRSPAGGWPECARSPLHFVAVLQAAGLDGFRQSLQRLLHAMGKPVSDGLLFFLAPAGAAQNERLLALGNRYLLHFHFRSHPQEMPGRS